MTRDPSFEWTPTEHVAGAATATLSPALARVVELATPALRDALSKCVDATGVCVLVLQMGPCVITRLQTTEHIAGVLRAMGRGDQADELEAPRGADRIRVVVFASLGEVGLVEYRRAGVNAPGGRA